MSVYVDELRQWPTRIRHFKSGACHMTADTAEELHAFAARLGLRREWFQPHPRLDHYDLTPAKRAKAVALGAVEMSMREQLIRLRSSEGYQQ